ncbi:MAG: tyrosine-type recombinase/integrase [Eubacteriales bacterium]|nr:tyrosine-type recombinase/integrase [Eubacteriales bacterium]
MERNYGAMHVMESGSQSWENPCLEDFLTYWFYQVEKNTVKPSTAATFYDLIYRHIVPKLGKYRLSDLNLFLLQAFFNQQYENGRIDRTGGLSYQTISSMCTILNSALNYAESNGILERNYCKDIRLPKREWKKVRVFTKEEQKKIEYAAIHSKNPNGIGIILCLYTGIRIGELCALHIGDVDICQRVLHVQRTLERIKCLENTGRKTMLYEGRPKSHSSIRDIPLPGFLVLLLQEYRDQYKPDAACDDSFISGKSGNPIEPRVYQKYFQTVLNRAGVGNANFHCLRHTFATRALEEGVDPKTLSELLGHSNASITMNIYAHSLYEHKYEAMEKLEAVYRV